MEGALKELHVLCFTIVLVAWCVFSGSLITRHDDRDTHQPHNGRLCVHSCICAVFMFHFTFESAHDINVIFLVYLETTRTTTTK